MQEHLHTRAAAGLFDVSHMGQIAVRPRSGELADAARALEALVPVDVAGLALGRQRYAVFTDDGGRDPRRPDGGEPGGPSAAGGQRGVKAEDLRTSRRGSPGRARWSRWSGG